MEIGGSDDNKVHMYQLDDQGNKVNVFNIDVDEKAREEREQQADAYKEYSARNVFM